jgi:hypothetical protein
MDLAYPQCDDGCVHVGEPNVRFALLKNVRNFRCWKLLLTAKWLSGRKEGAGKKEESEQWLLCIECFRINIVLLLTGLGGHCHVDQDERK